MPTNKTAKAIEGMEANLFERANYSHDRAERITYSNYSYWRSTVKTFLRRKLAVALLITVLLVVVFALIQPSLPNQFDPYYSTHLNEIDRWKEPPSSEHWFGTDSIGRDMWALVWEGTRISLSLAVTVSVIEIIIGVAIGALWGYVRRIDGFMTELYNIIANIPNLVLYLLVAYILKPSFTTMVIVMVSTNWIYMARLVRNLVLIIRDREYNLASRSLGTPVFRMLTMNIVPYLVSVIIMRLALTIPNVISSEIILTYLGAGLPATMASLGTLINSGQQLFTAFPHLLVFPVLFLCIITIGFTVVGNAFSDASDPRNHM